MGHTGAADGFDQSFLYNPILDIKRQLTGTLLRGTPANAVGQTRNIFNLIGFDPFALLRDRRWSMVGTLDNRVPVS